MKKLRLAPKSFSNLTVETAQDAQQSKRSDLPTTPLSSQSFSHDSLNESLATSSYSLSSTQRIIDVKLNIYFEKLIKI